MSSPAAWLAGALVAGVAWGATAAPSTWPLAVFVAAAWLAATWAFVRRRGAPLLAAVAAGAFASGAIIGAHDAAAARQPSLLAWSRAHPDTVAHLTGVIREDAAVGGYGVGLVVDALSLDQPDGSQSTAGGVRLTVSGALALTQVESWSAGRVVRCDVLLREPLDYRDPGVASDRERLARDGIVLFGTVKSAALLQVVGEGSWLAAGAAATRRHVRHAVGTGVGRWSVRSAGVVTAILIGDRTGLSPADERRLQEAGTYHVIAISGGNIALLAVLLLTTARWCGMRARLAAALAIAIVAFYGYLAGLAPSVARATAAGVVFLAARTLDHRGSVLNALGVAAVLAAIAAPLSVLNAGFVLSFGATVAIVVAADRLSPVLTRGREVAHARRVVFMILRAMAALLAATLAAELALVPVSARIFGRITAAGLPLNLVAIPLMSIVQVAGMVVVAVDPVSHAAAGAAGWVAHAATTGLLESARLVDAAPWLVRDVPPPAAWLMVAWYLAAVASLWPRPRVRRAGAAGIAAVLFAFLWGPPPLRAVRVPPPAPGWTRVVFLDVGQGDATLVWPAGAEPLLVDAGGVPGSAFDLGRRVTLPSLWAFGVTRLGALALTHGDPDHIGGAPPLLRAVSPREVWEGVPVPGHLPLAEVREAARAAGVPWRAVHRGDEWVRGAARIRVLHPVIPDWERRRVRNDDSIVLDVRVGDVSFVLPGDITAAVEPEVFDRFVAAPFTVVKAPHHGSAGSSSPALLAATHPAVVVFSAGQRNPFGHPAPAAVARYEAAGARIFRTDRDGAVVIDTDGRRVVVWGGIVWRTATRR